MNPLSKHNNFLLSAVVRDLPPYKLSQLTESQCHDFFAKERFGNLELFACPKCGVINKHYFRSDRRQWRCRDCDASFSCTSGTPFQDRKLPYKKILMCMAFFSNAANGVSAIKLAHDLDIQVKTARVLVGKIREALAKCIEPMQLSGTVEVDGGHFGGRPRSGRVRRKPSPEAVAAKAQAMINFQNGTGPKPKPSTSKANLWRLKKRRIVFVMRRHSGQKGFGADKTFVFIVTAEIAKEVMPFINLYVAPGATVMTDESNAYHSLSGTFTHHSVNHQIEYSFCRRLQRESSRKLLQSFAQVFHRRRT